MATVLSQPISTEEQAACFVHDPLGYVCWDFPWGEVGTILQDEEGPDAWQVEVLEAWGAHMRGGSASAFRHAVASGHGPGKTALVAWLIKFMMACRPNPQIVVTANTGIQLRTKTWRELAKWHNLSRTKGLFTWTATMYQHQQHTDTWFAAAIPWSERSIEAFQGTHERHVLMIFDEASAIPSAVYEAAEGSLTTADCSWFLFGNRTRATGRFAQCFPPHRFANRWQTMCVDSRTARHANQVQIQEWLEDYGEDSDFFRVRVRGLPPMAGNMQFIGYGLVAEAEKRSPMALPTQPRILALDVARYGLARSVLLLRQGQAIIEVEIHRRNDTVFLSRRVASWIKEFQPQAVFVDADGIGAGVVDILRDWGYTIIEVHGGSAAEDETLYFNKRAEMWGRVRGWLESGGGLPPVDRVEWSDELCTVDVGYDAKGRYQLERKDRVQAKVVDDPTFVSPDVGDALAMTFAEHVAPVVPGRQRLYPGNREPHLGAAPLYP